MGFLGFQKFIATIKNFIWSNKQVAAYEKYSDGVLVFWKILKINNGGLILWQEKL